MNAEINRKLDKLLEEFVSIKNELQTQNAKMAELDKANALHEQKLSDMEQKQNRCDNRIEDNECYAG